MKKVHAQIILLGNEIPGKQKKQKVYFHFVIKTVVKIWLQHNLDAIVGKALVSTTMFS
jgi:hypothetical protein